MKIPNSYVPMYTWEQDQVTFRPFSGVGCSAECGMSASEAGDDWVWDVIMRHRTFLQAKHDLFYLPAITR